jgi:hypothetical protein
VLAPTPSRRSSSASLGDTFIRTGPAPKFAS